MVEVPTEARADHAWIRWAVVSVWLLYLFPTAQALAQQPFGWPQVVGLAGLGVFAVAYVVGLGLGMWRAPRRAGHEWDLRARWLHMGLLVLLAALVFPGAGLAALHTAVFLTAAAAATLPRRAGLVVSASVLAAVVAAEQLVPGWSAHANEGVDVILAGAAVFAIRLAGERRDALVEAQRELHELALDEERDRIARDLHDILGHSLTVIVLKTELADRLLENDPARTREELTEIAALSREALADVRATIRRQRGGSLAEEIATARVALDTAGIRCQLPNAVDGVPLHVRELFAWAIREGVTNVIRHSGASRCTISCTAERLVIADDGRGAESPRPAGRGLAGIRERAAAVGAQVDTEALHDPPGYVLTVSLVPHQEQP